MYCFLSNAIILQPGSNIEKAAGEKSFPEPRLAIFNEESKAHTQGFIVAEGRILFEITDFSIPIALAALIGCYYVFDVSYPKPAPASGLLLSVQELLMGRHEQDVKKSARYSSLVDSIMIM